MNAQDYKQFPYEIQDVEPELAKELMEHYTGEKTGFVKVGPKGYFYPQLYRNEAADIYNMPIRPDDVFVHTFPRSGTTLTQELVWLICNDLDYEKAGSIKLFTRFPMMEFSLLLHPEIAKELNEENKDDEEALTFIKYIGMPSAQSMARLPSPRYIKTHLALSLLPPGLLDSAKMVYVARDPRDVAVSMYYLFKLLRTVNIAKDFKTHWKYFMNGLVYWSPYYEQVKEAWARRNHPNFLFIFYEDLANDMPAVVRRVATFLGKTYSDQKILELCDHLRFDRFKNNSSVDQNVSVRNFHRKGEEAFIRKGKVGGWCEYFDEEMRQQAERWMEDNLQDTDLRFPSYDKNSK